MIESTQFTNLAAIGFLWVGLLITWGTLLRIKDHGGILGLGFFGISFAAVAIFQSEWISMLLEHTIMFPVLLLIGFIISLGYLVHPIGWFWAGLLYLSLLSLKRGFATERALLPRLSYLALGIGSMAGWITLLWAASGASGIYLFDKLHVAIRDLGADLVERFGWLNPPPVVWVILLFLLPVGVILWMAYEREQTIELQRPNHMG